MNIYRIPIFISIFLLLSINIFSQSNEEKAEAFFKRGYEAHQSAALDDAINYYSAAITKNEAHSGALFNRSMAYFSKNQFQKCSKDLDAYLRLFPQDRDALERRANVAYLLKNYREAVEFYTRAISIAKSARLFSNRGIAYLEAGDPEQSLKDFQSALNADDGLAEAWVGAGNAWLAIGDFKKAESVFREAIRRGNKDHQLFFNLAISLAKMGNYSGALEQLNKALQLHEDAAALAHRAYCHFKLGNYRQASDDAITANNMDLRLVYAYHTLGLLASREKKYGAAEKLLSEGLSWEPNQAELLAARGYVRYKLQNYSTALEDLNYSIQLNPISGEAHYTRASVYHLLRQQMEACQDYRQAMKLGYEPFTEEDSTPFCEGINAKMEPKK